jgi:hypothetical protein
LAASARQKTLRAMRKRNRLGSVPPRNLGHAVGWRQPANSLGAARLAWS